ncbi:hypothetical protein Cgig2_004132 [Carnegiea gigantea]|uniref:Kinetochore protein SPC25 n=1 Tax=Carnegiea gigantea TaxID=171969 RepID=A0A9Q1KTD9_9CARY|nr:hypothetical protein Cgig2_004132 [Carnegiea gigantea]
MTSMESGRTKIEELRRVCDREIAANQQKFDAAVASFGKSLQTVRCNAEQSAHNQAEVGKLKAQLREREDELVKALAGVEMVTENIMFYVDLLMVAWRSLPTVKTRKEAKRMAIIDSLSETRVKVAELRKIVQDQAARKDEYAAILSQQSKALMDAKEKNKLASKHREEMQEAFSWYNRVLGFRIDGGHGVKFTFTNINRKRPAEEYSFTIRHSHDMYTCRCCCFFCAFNLLTEPVVSVLDCNPLLNGTEELVNELNKSNGLFQFVRVMREKFQAAASGSVSHYIYEDQDTTSISLSAPVSTVSAVSVDESPLPLREASGNIKKVNHLKGVKSPLSASAVRRSPRFKVNKPVEH